MNCPICSQPSTGVLNLVKDGTVYRAIRCSNGHHQVSDTRQHDLPVELDIAAGIHVARVSCGDNCFIFDRRMFRAAVRRVVRASRRGSGNLVLDLSKVGLVADGLLSVIRFVDAGLARRRRRLAVVAPSAAVQVHLLAAVPNLEGRIFRFEKDALAALIPDPNLSAESGAVV